MACWTVVIFSASSSGISVSNSSSRAITSSTVSSESAPRSSTKEDSFLISASFTPSCSATIFLTRCSTFSMYGLLPSCGLVPATLELKPPIVTESPGRRRPLQHVHSAVDVQRRAGAVAALRRGEEHHGRGDVFRFTQTAERDLREQRLALRLRQRARHVGVDVA